MSFVLELYADVRSCEEVERAAVATAENGLLSGEADARARRGYELEFDPPRSFQFTPSDVLRLAQETAAEGLIDLLGDMGIAGLGVSRWELMSAPHRIELTADLEAALAPLRRR